MSDNGDRRGRWQGFDFGGGGGGQGGPDKRRWRFTLGYLLLGLLLLWLLQAAFVPQPRNLAYSEFLVAVEEGRVEEASISETRISGEIRGESGPGFVTIRPPGVDEQELLTLLQERNVEFSGEQPSAFSNFLFSWILPIFILVAIWGFVFRRMAGGGAAGALNLGKRGVKIYDRKDLKTTFDDVAGVDEAVEELREIVAFLENPKKYQRLGGRIPKGVLLLGPPGCGKTLLARAVAGEAKVPFFFMSGSEFVEMFVGLGAARVRELFQQAKERAPCLVFLDELDTIGKTRAGALGAGMGSHDEREQTLNALLVEMDGFESNEGVILLAATNRPDVLDPALLRPGRFDRQVVVDLPDVKGREAILRVHAKKLPLADDVELGILARGTPGLSGADLANICNEAAIVAGRDRRERIETTDFQAALERVIAGMQSRRLITPHEKRVVAYHEAGHAVCAELLPAVEKVHRISIVPRGKALGYTLNLPEEDRYLKTREELMDYLVMLLGGRVTEHLIFGQITTGAADDLRKVHEISRSMVTQYGMGTGLMSRQLPADDYSMSDATRHSIDEEQQFIADQAHRRAQRMISEHRPLLEAFAQTLLHNEVLEREDIQRLVTEHEGDQPHQPRLEPIGGSEVRLAASKRLELEK